VSARCGKLANVTAKESLENLVSGLSEAEAAALLARISAAPSSGPVGPDTASPALALLRSWRQQPPVMSDQEWERFAREFDEERPERPLFS
jgi:hypothetical protein